MELLMTGKRFKMQKFFKKEQKIKHHIHYNARYLITYYLSVEKRDWKEIYHNVHGSFL